jgi:hypothetical protein
MIRSARTWEEEGFHDQVEWVVCIQLLTISTHMEAKDKADTIPWRPLARGLTP